jgi:nicotinate-nucleotide--dimethylbenzimidazole phosphoribosyltransferase
MMKAPAEHAVPFTLLSTTSAAWATTDDAPGSRWVAARQAGVAVEAAIAAASDAAVAARASRWPPQAQEPQQASAPPAKRRPRPSSAAHLKPPIILISDDDEGSAAPHAKRARPALPPWVPHIGAPLAANDEPLLSTPPPAIYGEPPPANDVASAASLTACSAACDLGTGPFFGAEVVSTASSGQAPPPAAPPAAAPLKQRTTAFKSLAAPPRPPPSFGLAPFFCCIDGRWVADPGSSSPSSKSQQPAEASAAHGCGSGGSSRRSLPPLSLEPPLRPVAAAAEPQPAAEAAEPQPLQPEPAAEAAEPQPLQPEPAAEASEPQPPQLQQLQPAAPSSEAQQFGLGLGEPDEPLYDFYGRPLYQAVAVPPPNGPVKLYRVGFARCIGQRVGDTLKVLKWLEDPNTGETLIGNEDTFIDTFRHPGPSRRL